MSHKYIGLFSAAVLKYCAIHVHEVLHTDPLCDIVMDYYAKSGENLTKDELDLAIKILYCFDYDGLWELGWDLLVIGGSIYALLSTPTGSYQVEVSPDLLDRLPDLASFLLASGAPYDIEVPDLSEIVEDIADILTRRFQYWILHSIPGTQTVSTLEPIRSYSQVCQGLPSK